MIPLGGVAILSIASVLAPISPGQPSPPPPSVWLPLASGWAQLLLHQGEEARVAFEQALECDPNNPWAHAGRGWLHAWRHEDSQARRDFTRAIQLRPTSPWLYYLRATHAHRCGKDSPALRDCSQAQHLAPSVAALYVLKADIYRGQKKDAEAREACERGLAAAPCTVLYLLRAVLCRHKGEDGEALEACAAALRRCPACAQAYQLRMLIWKSQRRWDRLAADAGELLRLLPGDADGHALQAQAYYHLRCWAAAVASCDRAIALQDNHADAHLVRGIILFRCGQLDRALEDLSCSLQARPRAYVYKLRAKVWLRKWDLASALADLDQAIRLQPGDVEPWINRSAIHLLRREYRQALSDCDEVLKFSPRCGPAHANRGAALVKLGPLYWQQALAAFDEAIAINPGDVESLANRAQLNSKWGKWDKVLADCDAVLRLRPGWKKYHRLRLDAFLARKEHAWARLELETLLQMTVPRDAGDYGSWGSSICSVPRSSRRS
jgi:tetratricopeptide (TPR) repeat protein